MKKICYSLLNFIIVLAFVVFSLINNVVYATVCSEDSECFAGYYCDISSLSCVPNNSDCTDYDEGCAEGEDCIGGTCVPSIGCLGDDDCPTGESCYAGVCQSNPPGTCVPACAEGYFCIVGDCVPELPEEETPEPPEEETPEPPEEETPELPEEETPELPEEETPEDPLEKGTCVTDEDCDQTGTYPEYCIDGDCLTPLEPPEEEPPAEDPPEKGTCVTDEDCDQTGTYPEQCIDGDCQIPSIY